MKEKIPLITILGPTAVGKTSLAVAIAYSIQSEIISADSRQVYKGMDIGTGKDIKEYDYQGVSIPYHLIDIVAPGTEYNIFRYQSDFNKVYSQIISRNRIPIVCGGSGMYLESILKNYQLPEIAESSSIHAELEKLSDSELLEKLSLLRKLHNTTDTLDRKRLIQAIEIELSKQESGCIPRCFQLYPSPVIGLRYERTTIRSRITRRLDDRIQQGMIREVELLLNQGVTPSQLMFYGLEYRFITQYILGDLNYEQMFSGLNTAIHQFAKRQMTWFRRMERNGIDIYWLDGEKGRESNLEEAINYIATWGLMKKF